MFNNLLVVVAAILVVLAAVVLQWRPKHTISLSPVPLCTHSTVVVGVSRVCAIRGGRGGGQRLPYLLQCSVLLLPPLSLTNYSLHLLIAHTASGKSFSHLQAQPPGITVSRTKRKKTGKHRYPQSGTGHSSFQQCPLSVHINARTAPQVSASFPSSLNRLCPPAVSKSGAPCCCALRTGGGRARACIQVGGLSIGLLRSPLLFPQIVIQYAV